MTLHKKTPAPPGAEPAPITPLDNLAAQVHSRLCSIGFASRSLKKNGAKTTIHQVPPKRLALAVMEVMDGKYDGDLEKFIAGLEAAHSPFVGPLKALAAEAKGEDEGERARLRQGLETWFDDEMNRLTAVYRRHARWVIGAVALVLTLLVGFDSFQYAGSVLDDHAKREQLVSAASSGDQESLRQMCAASSTPQAGSSPSPSSGASPA